jgi:hypothetical protein
MDEKYVIDLRELPPFKEAPFQSAEISIAVSFMPWFIPWRREKEFRFSTREQDGKHYWFARPLEK